MPLYELDGKAPALPDDGSAWIAPSADVIGDVRLGAGASIWFGSIVRADNGPILIGARTNIQDGSVLHSDPDAPLAIGADCTVGHRAILHGCSVGDRVLVGMGATILNNARIGDDCVIGANALITEGKVFEPGSLIVGAPARAVRTLSADDIKQLDFLAAAYVDEARIFAAQLRRVGA